jgi:hypothetical protein
MADSTESTVKPQQADPVTDTNVNISAASKPTGNDQEANVVEEFPDPDDDDLDDLDGKRSILKRGNIVLCQKVEIHGMAR